MSPIYFSIVAWGFFAAGLFLVVGTLLSLSRHPHWFIRGWDFPRIQILAGLLLFGGGYALFFFGGRWYEWGFVGAAAAATAWQAYRIFPYTRLASKTVEGAQHPARGLSLGLVASNVKMENEQHARWLEVVREADPDLVLALEVNDAWMQAIAELEEEYPHVVRQPQENYYGMVLFSRLPLADPQVKFLVQDDVPSIHTGVDLPGGERIYLHGVHPRPPEPLRHQDATPRDAEIVVLGRQIKKEDRSTITAGDFNDVAWSHTSELFLRLSQLLDPRRGRGFFNTFDAESHWMRFPLDHVFHSGAFKLIRLERLPYVGSDHFPVLVELSYEPERLQEQPQKEKVEEIEEAEEKIERAEEEEGAVEEDVTGGEDVAEDPVPASQNPPSSRRTP